MISINLLDFPLKTRSLSGKMQVWDIIRKKWVILNPEEHVRQLLLQYLVVALKYPPGLIAVEKSLDFGHARLRYDIVVFHRDAHEPWMLIECKAPEVPIQEGTLQQLLRYHSKLHQCRFWLITNGHECYCADVRQSETPVWLTSLPVY